MHAKQRKVLEKFGLVSAKPKKEGKLGKAAKRVQAKWKEIKQKVEASKVGRVYAKYKAMRKKAAAMRGAAESKAGAVTGGINQTMGVLRSIWTLVTGKSGGGGGL